MLCYSANFQPSRCIVHVVFESTKIHSLHCLAQLQMVHTERFRYICFGLDATAILLRCTWIHREEDDWGIILLLLHA